MIILYYYTTKNDFIIIIYYIIQPKHTLLSITVSSPPYMYPQFQLFMFNFKKKRSDHFVILLAKTFCTVSQTKQKLINNTKSIQKVYKKIH